MNKLQISRKIKDATEYMLSSPPERKTVKPSKTMAFSGVFCAMALVIMFFASLIGVGTYAGAITAAAALIPINEEFGSKTAVTAWAAISILAMILMPDRELALFFVCFGWYPMALRTLYKIKPRLLRIAVKLALYLILIGLMYGVLCSILGIDPELSENTRIMNISLLIAGGFTFLLCDAAYSRLILLWQMKWRKSFRKML